MLQQAILCFNLQKLPLVSQRSIFTHQTNTRSSVGYSPLSTEITPPSFHFLQRVRGSPAARPALPPLPGRDVGDTAEMEQVGLDPGVARGRSGVVPGTLVPASPVSAVFSAGKQPAPSLRSDGWMEGGARRFGAPLCWVSPPDPFRFCSAGLQ